MLASCLFSFALVSNSVNLCLDDSWIANIVLVNNVPILVKGVCARNASWDVDLKNLFWGEVLELHNKSAKAVAVCSNKNTLTCLKLWLDLLLEVRPCTCNGVLQALGVRKILCWNIAEHFLNVRIALVAWLKSWWLDIKGTTPNLYLLLAVLSSCISLVEALKCTIVALVQTPSLMNRKPVTVKLIKNMIQSVNSTLEQRSVANIKVIASLFKSTAASCCLLVTSLGKVNVGPTSEQVELVPLRLTVANNNQVPVLIFSQ